MRQKMSSTSTSRTWRVKASRTAGSGCAGGSPAAASPGHRLKIHKRACELARARVAAPRVHEELGRQARLLRAQAREEVDAAQSRAELSLALLLAAARSGAHVVVVVVVEDDICAVA